MNIDSESSLDTEERWDSHVRCLATRDNVYRVSLKKDLVPTTAAR